MIEDPVRVLYVTNAELGRPNAPATRAKGLSCALTRQGISVHLLGTEPPPSIPLPGVQVTSLRRPPLRKLGTLIWHVHLGSRLADLLTRRFDLVLMREIPFTPEPILYAGFKGIPLVLEVNGIAPEMRDNNRSLARHMYLRNYRAAARIVVLTEGLKRHLVDRFDVPVARIRIIPNAADTSRFRPLPRVDSRRQMDIPADAFCILYMGSYHTQQGIECVIPLCRSLRARIPDHLFLMTGDGPGRDALKREIEDEGLSRWFRFLGTVSDSDLPACISSADSALSPIRPQDAWRTEVTFPQKIVEYLACGVPVLAMGHSAPQRAMLEEGGAGKLVDAGPGHVERMTNLLLDWHRNPAARERMGARGRALIETRCNYEAVASQFADLFRDL